MTSLKNGQNGQTCVWIIIIVIVIVVLIAIIVSSINLSLSLFLFLGVQTSSLLCSCCRAASTLKLRPFFSAAAEGPAGRSIAFDPTDPHTPHSTSVSRLEVLEMIFPVAGESSLVYGNCCWNNFKLRGVRTAPTAVLCSTWCCPLLLLMLMLPAAFTRNFP